MLIQHFAAGRRVGRPAPHVHNAVVAALAVAAVVVRWAAAILLRRAAAQTVLTPRRRFRTGQKANALTAHALFHVLRTALLLVGGLVVWAAAEIVFAPADADCSRAEPAIAVAAVPPAVLRRHRAAQGLFDQRALIRAAAHLCARPRRHRFNEKAWREAFATAADAARVRAAGGL